jgi:hypothetical protein
VRKGIEQKTATGFTPKKGGIFIGRREQQPLLLQYIEGH